MCPFIRTLHLALLPLVERAVLAARLGVEYRLLGCRSLRVRGVYTRAFLGSDSLIIPTHWRQLDQHNLIKKGGKKVKKR